MSIFEWRKCNFFDLKADPDNGKLIEALKDSQISCGTSGRGQYILCDSSGGINILTRYWENTYFKGHDSEILLCALSKTNLLITISCENFGETPILKIWNLSKLTKTNGAPCLRTVKIALQKPTALGVSDNGQMMAIGYALGGISLYRGDITRDKSSAMKQLSSGTSEITGIEFKQQGNNTHMFVCSDSAVVVYFIQGKDKETKTILEDKLLPRRCCAMEGNQGANDSHFMIGRDDSIFYYTIDGCGPSYPLDGEKIMIKWFRTHLISISKSKTSKNVSYQKNCTLTVIDTQNNFIVYATQIDSVAAIFVEFGECFIVTKGIKVYQLYEKDLQSKLDIVFKKNLYDIAITIAENEQYGSEGLAGIFCQYGDHLYAKGKFSESIDQYIKTIDYIEPSYVIRKFLDSRHIHVLTKYLQALHKKGQATTDHTTLLLNCFTRLELTDELKNFLSNDKNPDIKYDLDIAIRDCRKVLVDVAYNLAVRNMKHDHVVDIIIEDIKQYEEALNYISKLNCNDAVKILLKYGTVLMAQCPQATTELLKKLIIDYENLELQNNFFDNVKVNPEDFMNLFVKNLDCLLDFLDYIVNNLKNCSPNIINTLIELHLQKWNGDNEMEKRLMEILKTHKGTYDLNHVLILCRLYKFWPGTLWIYEEEKLYHFVVRHYLKNKNYEGLLTCCKTLGSTQPALWLQALTGLRNDVEAPPELILKVLNVIANEKLQSPLQVLNCLAIQNGLKLSSVRDYFLQIARKEQKCAKQDESSVQTLKKTLVDLQDHITYLQTKPIEFRNTMCCTCRQPLNMPAVYFLCQHSFHLDCILKYTWNEKDCNMCKEKNTRLIEKIREQNDAHKQQGIFFDSLKHSTDSFSVVSEYFGKGLFNKFEEMEETPPIIPNQVKPEFNYLPRKEMHVPDVRPKAEARIRLEESSKYVIKEPKHVEPKIGAGKVTKPYDERKNPFADAGNPFEKEDVVVVAKPGNPFEEVGSNPFETDDNDNIA